MTSARLLSFPFKYTEEVDYVAAIEAHAEQHFRNDVPDSHPDALLPDARQLHQLRKDASVVPNSSGSDHRAGSSSNAPLNVTLSRMVLYHAQIVYMLTKFPTDLGVAFPWYALYSAPPGSGPGSSTVADYLLPGTLPTQVPIERFDLIFEQCCLLINIAAAYAQLAVVEDRSQAEGMKQAIANLQNAAGVLQYLQDSILPKLQKLNDGAEPVSPDLQPSALEALKSFCLAQAQECYFQRAVADHKKNGVIAKVAGKVAEYYAAALDAAQSAKAAGGAWPTWTFPTDWINHVTYKRWHFAAVAQYRKSLDDSGANRYGDELGRLHVAQKYVRNGLDASKKGVAQSVVTDIKSLQATLTDLIGRAERDNRLIYHEAVTSESSLAAIVPADMVKAAVPQEIEYPIPRLHVGRGGLGQRPLFENMVPFAIHLAIALYDDRKQELIRTEILSKKDELDARANQVLQSNKLPGSIQALEVPQGLPPTLVRKAEELRRDGGTKRLRTLMQDSLSTASTNYKVLQDVTDLLAQEESEDAQLRQHYGTERWSRQPSVELNGQLRAKIAKFKYTLDTAAKSDHAIRDKMTEWEGALSLLEGPRDALEAAIPSAAKAKPGYDDLTSSSSQVGLVRELRRQLEDLDDLTAARRRIADTAQRTASTDSIRTPVMQLAAELTASSSQALDAAQFDSLFQEHLEKYSVFCDTLAGNERKQDDLLDRISKTNERFVHARTNDPTAKEREETLQRLDTAFAKFKDIGSNLREAFHFYQDFAKLLDQLRVTVREWVHARRTEAQAMLNAINMDSMSIHESAATSPEPSNAPDVPPTARSANGTHRTVAAPPTPGTIRAQQPGQWQPGMPIKFG